MESQDISMNEIEAVRPYIQNVVGHIQNIKDQMKDLQNSIQNGQIGQEIMEERQDMAHNIQDTINAMETDVQSIFNEIQDGHYSREMKQFYQNIMRDIQNGIQAAQTEMQGVQDTLQDIQDHYQNGINHEEFGEDWFRWEDWRIDQAFMEHFYATLNKMMEEDGKIMPPAIPGLVNPIIQMLTRKKGDAKYRKLNVDKMIRFFSMVGVKYWYAVNTGLYDPHEAINTLKLNASMTNSQYREFVKRNPSREK